MTGFTTLEKEATKALIEVDRGAALTPEAADILLEQFRVATVKERNVDGYGFFTYFTIPDGAPRIPEKKPFRLDGVAVEIEGIPNAAAFLLLIEDGALTHLEGFTEALD